MSKYTQDELRQRAFYRAAWVLKHFWEEQKDHPKREASVHTRIFDTLVPRCHIEIGQSVKGGGHVEHLVPCVMLRDQAFSMFWDGKDEHHVAEMLGKYLRIAHINPAEADDLDHKLKLKTTMPDGWNWENGSVLARLQKGNITLVMNSTTD